MPEEGQHSLRPARHAQLALTFQIKNGEIWDVDYEDCH
jgi:hypothetical protein